MKKALKIVIFLLLLVIAAGFMLLRLFAMNEEDTAIEAASVAVTAAPQPTSEPTPEPTAEPTPEPTPEPSPEPTPELFTISAIGDCTLYSHQQQPPTSPYSYTYIMGDNYAYPFSRTVQYFAEDDLTIANLECTLSDTKLYSDTFFHFLAPAAYANILVEGKVDFVNTANNHTADYGLEGIQNTCAALDAAGVPYCKEGESKLLTTDSGLTVGIYCDYNGYYPKADKCVTAISQLISDGAEYVICMFHWGQDEMVYHPKQEQIDLAHACIDAGADLVYGSHSHCLQPIEEYSGAYILYSMGNWSFGGSTSPRDMDTAIVQIEVQRDLDGTVSNAGLKIIPCCVSSKPVLEGYTGEAYNDYCPTPYAEGTEEYDRAMSKLMGTYEGADGVVDYSSWLASFG